jgi:hypothetical protein
MPPFQGLGLGMIYRHRALPDVKVKGPFRAISSHTTIPKVINYQLDSFYHLKVKENHIKSQSWIKLENFKSFEI